MAGLSLKVDDELKPYLTYSLAVHAALAVLFAARGLFAFSKSAPSTVYTIDFVGPSSQIVTAALASAAGRSAPAERSSSPEQKEADDFSTHKRHGRFVLPKPSLLSGYQAPKAAAKPAMAQAPAASDSAASPSAGNAAVGEAGAGIATDMPNFPYPWYISQVRAGLWSQWSAKRPSQAAECVVMFSILPSGGIVDLRVEESSGDAAFDLAAMGAAQDASPFPPLPREFKDPFLKIHVTLKSQ